MVGVFVGLDDVEELVDVGEADDADDSDAERVAVSKRTLCI
jgi:hypothetical protein